MKIVRLSDVLTTVTRLELSCQPDYSDFVPAEVKRVITNEIPSVDAVDADRLIVEVDKYAVLTNAPGRYIEVSTLHDIIRNLKLKGD